MVRKDVKMPVISISPLRINQDGTGIRSLVVSAECPLKCKYCINDYCHSYPDNKIKWLSVNSLYSQIKSHRVYYWASGGGLVFGGGEPLIHEEFVYNFCQNHSKEFYINIETSLNVELKHLCELKEMIHEFIVDIKTLDSVIYEKYTGVSNQALTKNLKAMTDIADKIIIRIPVIPEYTTEAEQIRDMETLKSMGFHKFNLFKYTVSNRK